jgi:phosphoglycerate dehydrogenase-like enzyme
VHEPLDILIYDASYRRLEPQLRAIASDARFSLMDDNGGVTVNGEATPLDRVRATVGWPNWDTYAARCRREYFDALLRIETMRWVQSSAAGVENPVFGQLAAKGVIVTNSDAQGPAIAEFILGAALDIFQRADERRQAQAERQWKRTWFRELGDTTWLIVGFGHIGRETARRLHGFGATVIGVRRQIHEDPLAARVITLDRLPEYLPLADVVVLSCALNDRTRNLANAAFFERMRPGSLFVNVGRGGLVDEAALIAALDRGSPQRAILDVFAMEPLPGDSALWGHPNVRISAHTSALGNRSARRGDELFLDNLQRYMRGETLRNIVHPEDLATEAVAGKDSAG